MELKIEELEAVHGGVAPALIIAGRLALAGLGIGGAITAGHGFIDSLWKLR